MYRGFDEGLIKRATDARYGDRFYFSEGALRAFNAYGGKYLSATENEFVLVDSIRFEQEPRQYRVLVVTFSGEPHRETVKVARTDNYPSAPKAIAAYQAGDVT